MRIDNKFEVINLGKAVYVRHEDSLILYKEFKTKLHAWFYYKRCIKVINKGKGVR